MPGPDVTDGSRSDMLYMPRYFPSHLMGKFRLELLPFGIDTDQASSRSLGILNRSPVCTGSRAPSTIHPRSLTNYYIMSHDSHEHAVRVL